MKSHPILRRFLLVLLCVGLVFGTVGPIGFTPSAEAASAVRKKFRKCKKALRKQNALVRQLRRELAVALLPPPASPTPGMVLVPAGNFVMGDADNGSTGGAADELPAHAVTVSAFYIDRFEVTKELWDKVAAWGASNGYSDLPAGDGQGKFHPVQGIRWYSAVKWCNARSEMEGLTPAYYTDATQATVYRTGTVNLENSFVKWAANGFRLPTEAQWEKATRGGVAGQTYPWGFAIATSDANYHGSGDPFDDLGVPKTTPVGFYDGGQLPAGVDRGNGFGLYDVAGNVLEWCWDRYGMSYYSSSPDTDPRGPSTGNARVVRGGSWSVSGGALRCALRGDLNPLNKFPSLGFRSVRGP